MTKNTVTVGPNQLRAVQMVEQCLSADPSQAVCGPIGMSAKDAINILSNKPIQKTKDEPNNIDKLIYASMLQAGVNLFRIPKIEDQISTQSQYFKNHIEYYTDDEYQVILNEVRKNLLKFIPEYDFENGAWSTVNDVESFIIELLLATNHGTNIVFLTAPPTQKAVSECFPVEFSVIFNNFLSAFHQDTLQLPASQFFISIENVQQFNEILNSDLFSQYSEAQNEISVIETSESTAIANLAKKSTALIKKYVDLASPKETVVSILEVTPKVINHIFGEITGDIVELLSKPLKNALNSKRRIVVYDLSSILFNIVHENLLLKFDKKSNDNFSVVFPSINNESAMLLEKFMGRKANNDATVKNNQKLSRNAPCPCGSGKHFKHCHGKL